MGKNLRLSGRNVADEATVTVTSAAAYLPVSNLKLTTRARVWRSTSAAQQTIDLTWGGNGVNVSVVMINRHNLEPNARWRVRGYMNSDWTGTVLFDSQVGGINPLAYDASTLSDLNWGFDPLGASVFTSYLGQRFSVYHVVPADTSPSVVKGGNVISPGTGTVGVNSPPLVVVPASVIPLSTREPGAATIKSMRIDLIDTGNSAGYIQASRLFVGEAVELTFNPESINLAWLEDTKQARSGGGTLRSDGGWAFREVSATLPLVNEAQRTTLLNIFRWAGLRKDIFFSGFPLNSGLLADQKERDYCMIGRFTKMPVMQLSGKMKMYYNTQFTVQEI